jgi:hypothetical protein
MRRRLFIILALVTTITACGSTSTKDATPASSTSTSSPASTVPSGTSTTGVTEASIPPTSPTRFLTGVSASHLDGHDQVAFTFQDGVPGYTAQYITPPLTSDGEGAPVSISGDSVLKIVFASAGTVDLSNGGKKYYSGPKRFSPTGTTIISEVVDVSEFEGHLLWGIGTKSKSQFTVTTTSTTLTFVFN